MREIKFRAWDEKRKHYLGNWEYVIDPDGRGVLEQVGYDPEYEKFRLNHETTLEQFTGLHDKNGKEIYEGDIVECSGGCPHQVIWMEEHGRTFIGGMPSWYLSGIYNGYAWTGTERLIGNIHENPELLEKIGTE